MSQKLRGHDTRAGHKVTERRQVERGERFRERGRSGGNGEEERDYVARVVGEDKAVPEEKLLI